MEPNKYTVEKKNIASSYGVKSTKLFRCNQLRTILTEMEHELFCFAFQLFTY